jgi:hypothetical protein
MHLLGYAANLDKRYGEGSAQALIDRYVKSKTKTTKEWSQVQYIEQIGRIMAKYNELDLSTGVDNS